MIKEKLKKWIFCKLMITGKNFIAWAYEKKKENSSMKEKANPI